MQEAFTIREAIIGLFKDQKVEASFSDFFLFFFRFFREDDQNTLLPLEEHLVLRNLIFTHVQAPLNVIEFRRPDLMQH